MFYPLQLIINVTYSRRRVGGGAMQASLVAVTRGRKIRTFNVTKKRLPGTYKGGRQAGTPTILTENDKTENRHVNVFFFLNYCELHRFAPAHRSPRDILLDTIIVPPPCRGEELYSNWREHMRKARDEAAPVFTPRGNSLKVALGGVTDRAGAQQTPRVSDGSDIRR